MSRRNFTVVFVPGAWHSPDSYDAVISHLDKHGYQVAKVWTPSVLRNGAKAIENMNADVEEARKHVKAATDAGQKVVIVMHSYGGIPGSQAAEGFDQATMAAQGHTDGRGVVHMIYLAAFMLRVGEALSDTGSIPDWQDLLPGGMLVTKRQDEIFYNDFESKAEIDHWIAQLNPWSAIVTRFRLTHVPWKLMPATYLACEKDNAIAIDLQVQMVQRAIEAGAIDLRLLRWPGGHSPQGVRPLDVSRIIRNAVGDLDEPFL